MAAIVQIFARAPLRGTVKRRLARDLGERRTMKIYRALLAGTLQTVAEADVPAEIWVAGSPFHPWLRKMTRRHQMRIRVQHGADLGERMWRALRHGLDRSPSVILIGSDCPGLTATHLHQARAALTSADRIALGPSTDGGYYLIGTRCAPRALFTAIDWGSDRVLDQTRARLRRLELSECSLAPLTDLDDRTSLDELRSGCGTQSGIKPRASAGATGRTARWR